jgi:hypothetical protein
VKNTTLVGADVCNIMILLLLLLGRVRDGDGQLLRGHGAHGEGTVVLISAHSVILVVVLCSVVFCDKSLWHTAGKAKDDRDAPAAQVCANGDSVQ